MTCFVFIVSNRELGLHDITSILGCSQATSALSWSMVLDTNKDNGCLTILLCCGFKDERAKTGEMKVELVLDKGNNLSPDYKYGKITEKDNQQVNIV